MRRRWPVIVIPLLVVGLTACDIDWSDTFDSSDNDDNTADIEDTDIPGLDVAISDYQFDQTYQNLADRVDRQNYYRVVSVDLAAEAADTDEDIRPTRVILYDDANRITPIIAADRRAGLDLPPAVLVYRDDDDNDNNDNVGVAYNSSDYLAACYDVADAQDALDALESDQESLVADVAGNDISRQGRVDTLSEGQGLVDRTSDNDFDTTLDQLVEAIGDDNDLQLVAQIDHREAARQIGSMLDANDDPSTLVIFNAGRPQARLIAGGQTVAVDLPVRMLVSQDTDGVVHINYSQPRYLEDRHDLDTDNAADDLRDTLRDLVDDAID
ncbi:DUF302 domain-containing protein [Salinisphaera sp. SPP-AMP-43]|uniref:DUF302 domain-containing protein n=1 Tax=Salinisphaera sp. SPP-AMP-43 TaxID=3121288 RepID=UPI003C6E5283